MKIRINFMVVITGLLVFCALKPIQNNPIKKAAWLIGTWENKTSEGSIYETWSKTSQHEFSGKSYMVNENDTIVFENVSLLQEQGILYYIPIVKNQNNDLPVRFALKTISKTRLVFENPQHDFPQIISYTKIHADSLVAEISGTIKGEHRTQVFPMRRLK